MHHNRCQGRDGRIDEAILGSGALRVEVESIKDIVHLQSQQSVAAALLLADTTGALRRRSFTSKIHDARLFAAHAGLAADKLFNQR